MNQFMGVMTDPFSDGRARTASASGVTPYADDEAHRLCRRPQALEQRARGLCRDLPQGAAGANLGSALERVGAGLWRLADHGRQCAARIATPRTSRMFGMAAGADYRFSPNTVAGFALAGGGTNFCVANGGSGRSDLFQAGAFVRHTVGAAYITGALAYGWQDVTTDRTVTIAGIDRLRAQFNANAFSGRVEAGYRFVTPWIGGVGITPYAAGQFTTFDLPAYAEQVVSGANTFALAYGAKSVTATPQRTRPARRQILCDAERASSPCAAAPPGRTTSIPIAPSARPFRRCPAQASSSTAQGRPATPRSPRHRPK